MRTPTSPCRAAESHLQPSSWSDKKSSRRWSVTKRVKPVDQLLDSLRNQDGPSQWKGRKSTNPQYTIPKDNDNDHRLDSRRDTTGRSLAVRINTNVVNIPNLSPTPEAKKEGGTAKNGDKDTEKRLEEEEAKDVDVEDEKEISHADRSCQQNIDTQVAAVSQGTGDTVCLIIIANK